MALKILKSCQNCVNDCKQQVDEIVWKNAYVVACPKGRKFKKKKR